MTEDQLRDVLARAVPEPPDSVADPAPVVRAARRQRRVATAAVGAVAVLAVVGTVLGVQAIRADDGPDFVDEPAQIADPFTTAPCPDAGQPWENGLVASLDGLTAVRHCTRPSELDSTTYVGPADALVVDLDAFAQTVRAIPEADPARCAAVSVVPIDNRALFQLGDGSVVGVGTGLCDDVEVEGRVLAGTDLVAALFESLREQRTTYHYTTSLQAPDADWCGTHRGTSPAMPADEHLVAATWCGPDSPDSGGVVLDDATVERLDDAWRAAEPTDPEESFECDEFGGSGQHILARTDRGDVVSLDDQGCGQTAYSPFSVEPMGGETLSFDFAIPDLG
jgi:hypothetical protein